MSNSNGLPHMSASQRKINAQEQQIAMLQQMAREYEAFVNYVILQHGEHDPETEGDDKQFVVYEDLLKKMEVISDVPYADGVFYEKGVRAKLFRVHNSYLKEKDLSIVIFENEGVIREFICDLELDKRYIKTIRSVELNLKNAIIDEINH